MGPTNSRAGAAPIGTRKRSGRLKHFTDEYVRRADVHDVAMTDPTRGREGEEEGRREEEKFEDGSGIFSVTKALADLLVGPMCPPWSESSCQPSSYKLVAVLPHCGPRHSYYLVAVTSLSSALLVLGPPTSSTLVLGLPTSSPAAAFFGFAFFIGTAAPPELAPADDAELAADPDGTCPSWEPS